MNKPNCYECLYRGDLLGDCHICCKHPSNLKILNKSLSQIMAIFTGVRGIPPILALSYGTKVVGNEYGIKHGWFNYPLNFDPLWLISCNGFHKKEGTCQKKS